MGDARRPGTGSPSPTRRARAVSVDMGAAWLLDPKSFHDEFDELYHGLAGGDGLERFWHRAVAVCEDPDPVVRRYLATVEVCPPADWSPTFGDEHLAEWYRILMARHLRPTVALRSPGAIKDRLPDLGWARADARRLAFGRELGTLAEEFADAACAATMSTALPLGTKGWLGQADIAGYLAALPSLRHDRGVPPNLVPLIEEIYHVLRAASAANDRVLLLPPG